MPTPRYRTILPPGTKRPRNKPETTADAPTTAEEREAQRLAKLRENAAKARAVRDANTQARKAAREAGEEVAGYNASATRAGGIGAKRGRKARSTVHEDGLAVALQVARNIMQSKDASESSRVSALKAYTDLLARNEQQIKAVDVPHELSLFMAEHLPEHVKGYGEGYGLL
jgi:hypothetical protein